MTERPEQTLVRLLVEPAPLTDTAIPWPAVVRTAIQWRVGSLLLTRLDRYSGQVPAGARALLTAHHLQDFSRSALIAGKGARLCRDLEEQGIPVVAFKGLGVMAQLYAGPQERSTSDVDLLVREQDLDRAVGALTASGFALGLAVDLATYRQELRELGGYGGNQAITLTHPEWGSADLHWRFGRNPVAEMDPARILQRAEWCSLLGHRIRVIGPVDGLVLAAHHAVREGFNPAGMIRDLLDAQRWLERLETLGKLDEALAHVERCRIAAPVAAMASLLGHRTVIERLEATAASRDLVLLFQLQLYGWSATRDVQRLADPREWRKMWRYGFGGVAVYHRLLAGQTPGQRVPWTERFSRVTRSLAGLEPNHWKRWRALRTIVRIRAGYQDVSGR